MNSGYVRGDIQLLDETSAEGIIDTFVESGGFRDVRLTLYFDFVEHTFERRKKRWESI
jgi:hypothetical protein